MLKFKSFGTNLQRSLYIIVVLICTAKAREPDEFVAFPNEMEENQSITLTCSANVGSPRGYIQIWKYSDTHQLIYTSNSTNSKTNNCTKFINVTTTYTVSKDDNGAIFRCSSQNNLTRGPGPSKISSRISVTCMYEHFYANIFYFIFRYSINKILSFVKY